MTSKESNATKVKDKLSNSTLVLSSQDGAQAVETSPEVNAGADQEMKTTSNISDLGTAVTSTDTIRSGSESTLDTISPTSAASPKRERNRRKKENAKKRKAEKLKNKADETNALAGMGTMALNERVLGGAGNGNSQPRLSFSSNGSSSSSSPTQSESTEQQTLDTLNNQPGRLWEVKQAGGKGLGVFAIQLIKKGTIIFQEVPLIRGGQNWLDKEAAFMLLPEAKKRDFMALHNRCNCHKSPCQETTLMRIWDVNSFDLASIGQGNVGVFKVASRINHACFPNAFRRFTKDGNIVIIYSEDIKKGCEITLDYSGVCGVPVASRRKYLLETYKRPVEVTTTEILGEKTTEELDALAGFKSWHQDLEKYILVFHDNAASILRDSFIRGNDTREVLKDRCRSMVGDWLRANNNFGLSEDVIEKYSIRMSLRYKQAADILFDGMQGGNPAVLDVLNQLCGN
ncbi:hypothetical protein F5882DRAFT_485684 [Hyaloscypha sp. PMI_1271]|nr:hypothetical protein F5882DRAFT_485684 [Hyaloscypha sp. PMI_1271]